MARSKLSTEQLFEITSKINSSDSLPLLLDSIIQITKEVLNSEGCSLLLYSKEEDCLIFHTSKGERSELLTSLKVPKGKGIAGLVLETLKPIIVNDALNDSRVYRNIDQTVGYTTHNLVCVPMIAQGEVQGVIEAVNSLSADGYDENDLDLLSNMSNIAAIAIRNRLLMDELEIKYNQINCLLKISNALRNINTLENFLEVAFHAIMDIIPVYRFSFAYKSRSKSEWRLIKTYGFELSNYYIDPTKGVMGKVLESGKPLLVENIDHVEFKLPKSSLYRTKSFVSIPLYLNNEILGVFNISDRKDLKPFDKSDLNLFTLISNHIIEAYKSLTVKEHQEKLENLQRDLSIASKIQQYSLPHIPKNLHGILLEAHYQSSKEIGGDFYDLIYHNTNEFSILIADVSGKGISAALFMEFSKTILSSEISRNSSPSESLLNSDIVIKDRFSFLMLVEVMLIRINTLEQKIIYSSAGHNRQFFQRKSTGKVELLSGKGIPLGSSIKKFTISEQILKYEKGDRIILYTDGITETLNSNKEMFGEERLIELLESNLHLSIEKLKTKILLATDEFRGEKEFLDDDLTLLLVEL
jgi:serine phosphatase RsbU (regulator of sigma subunit)